VGAWLWPQGSAGSSSGQGSTTATTTHREELGGGTPGPTTAATGDPRGGSPTTVPRINPTIVIPDQPGPDPTTAPAPPPLPPPNPPADGDEQPPTRQEAYSWPRDQVIRPASDSADWDANYGPWGPGDLAWYSDGIRVGGNAGAVSSARPLVHSSCQEAWANRDLGLPPMQAGIKFCVFVGGANAMISVRSVNAGIAEIDIAVWQG
jgi:hypothetical protein